MICQTLVLVLLTTSTWNFTDVRNIRSAGNTCAETKECLSKFVKLEDNRYRAYCKIPKKEKK